MINPQALKDRLQIVAKEKKIPFNACWKQLLLERFLVRLGGSTHVDKFIFKGGFLLSYLMKMGRETVDLDFLLTRMKAEERVLERAFQQIISIHYSDGFAFAFDGIELLRRPQMEYPGYRIILNAGFSKMRDKIQIDVGVGDIVEPLTREIPLVHYRGKPFFENAVSLRAYPVETIFAEKLQTIISKGESNSRMKDFHDLILLIRAEGLLDLKQLNEAIERTFSNRGTLLNLIKFNESSLKAIQKLWIAHLQGLGNQAEDLGLPQDILTLIQELNAYLARRLTKMLAVKAGRD